MPPAVSRGGRRNELFLFLAFYLGLKQPLGKRLTIHAPNQDDEETHNEIGQKKFPIGRREPLMLVCRCA